MPWPFRHSILGEAIYCASRVLLLRVVPQMSTSRASGGTGPAAWVLKLQNCPASMEREAMRAALEEYARPRVLTPPPGARGSVWYATFLEETEAKTVLLNVAVGAADVV
jgi:hypothetical protein